MNRPKLTQRDDAGLRKLAGAVLLQALEDLNEGEAQVREDAWEWLSGRNEAGLSFSICCKLLGRQPEDLRGSILPPRVVSQTDVVAAHLPAPSAPAVEQFAN